MKKKREWFFPQGGINKLNLTIIFTMIVFFTFGNGSTFIQQQQRTITGVVTDQRGQSLPGVTVIVPGTTTGTVTNNNGEFSLTIPATAVALQFSFVGMRMQEVALGGRSTITVTMEEETIGLDEVVAVGYGTQKRSDITGTVASISKDRLEMVPNINITQAIQGAIPGVMVQTTSAGAAPNEVILVRGRNSILASNTPLIVVDGIPYGGSMSDLNPNEVESIEILKDASAAAIYGSRGSNGVILITTKTGQRGDARLTYDGYYGIQNFANLVKPMDGYEFYHFKQERFPGQITLSEQAIYDAGEWVDWMDVGLRKGNSQQHNLAASGGFQNTTYYIGGGLTKVQGLRLNDNYLRISTRINVDTKIANWLSIGTRTQLSYDDQSGAPVSMSALFTRNPLAKPFDEDGNITMYPWPEDDGSNPLEPTLYDNKSLSYQIVTNNYALIDFPFITGLSYRINAGVRYRFRDDAEYRDRTSLSGFQANGRSDTRNRQYNNYVLENILSYTREIERHNIFATGVFSLEEESYSDRRTQASEFPHDFLSYYSIAQAEVVNNSYGFNQTNLVSQMLRINYSFDNRYLLTLTGRRDGYSGFGSDSKWGFFPSVALGWNILNEDFISNNELLSNLRFRASWGLNGNQAVGAYESISRLSTNDYVDGGTTLAGYRPSRLGQENLGWEASETLNFGLDYGFLNQRITGDLNIFSTNTSDLLLNRTISAVHGITSITQNIGETKNQGVEFSINSRNVVSQNKGFTWNTSGNLAYIRNRIISLYGIFDEQGREIDDPGNAWFIGHPIRVNYDYKWLGTWQLNEAEEAAKWNSQPGFVKLEDVNGDGVLDANDRQILGQQDPKVIWGMTNSFSYQNIRLDIFMHGVHGVTQNVYPYLTDLETFSVIRRNTFRKNWWTPDNPTNDFVMNHISAEYMAGIRGYVYEDASFIRIKDISLSYDLGSLVNSIGISRLRVYATGRNLFTITKWRGLDPELDSQTGTPLQKEYIFGVNLGF
jgi:TonB-linked SusC/RagA family outer membrane protein